MYSSVTFDEQQVEVDPYPNQSVFEVQQNGSMNFITKIFHWTSSLGQHNRCRVIRQLTFGFRIDTDQFQVGPQFLQKIIEIPFMMCRDRHTVRNFIDDVEFFDGDLIDLVQDVDSRDVNTVAFD